MTIFLSDQQVASLPWHDADIYFVKSFWSEAEELQVRIRVGINSEESLQPLIDMGLNAAIIEARFHQVWRLKTDFRGDSFPKEVLADWTIVKTSVLIDEIRHQGMAGNIDLRHHQILFSNGSIADIVFEHISLESS